MSAGSPSHGVSGFARALGFFQPTLKPSAISRASAGLAIALGLLVCTGWVFDLPSLRSVFPGFPEMKFNAATLFILAGIALWMSNVPGIARSLIARSCAAVVALIGALTLSEYLIGRDFGIDQLLFADFTHDSPHPGRIPFAGALNFLLLGSVLGLLDVPPRRDGRWGKPWPSQWLAILLATISFVVVLGYTYEVSSLYRSRSSSPVALHGVMLFLALALGALLARADRGLAARVLSEDAGGFLARRLLPAAILIPPTLGWLRLQGEHAGLYGTDVGLALYATANVLIFSALIWHTAAVVRRADEERRAHEVKLRGQVSRLDLLSHITRGIGERQDLHSVFQVVIRSLEDHLPIDFGCICLHEPASNTVTVACIGSQTVSLGGEPLTGEHARIPVEGNGLARCLQGALVYEPDIDGVLFPFPQRLARAGLRAVVIAPLRVESEVFGVLVAARTRPSSFSSGECEFLRQLAEHVALATHQAQLYNALQRAYDDLRQSQHAAAQQERLRALGQMASGIAHDINNALSPTALYVQSMLEREVGLSREGRERLGTISRAIDDVAHTISRMRDFYRSRDQEMDLASVDVNDIVRQVLELTRARWRDLPQERGVTIELRTELAPSLPTIPGAETEIRDALTNLIFNACDAMAGGGTLTVCTRAGIESTHAGASQVSVAVSDSGTGMDEETRRRCLEPFFTTKGERGTGLGLAMVYGMVKRHGGELEIESTLGAGTTVRMDFPAGQAPAETVATTIGVERGPIRRLRVLVIDDDPFLTQSLRDTLEADGHRVSVADGGQSGIDAFVAARRRGETFNIVITDLGMPYVDGRKVAAAVRERAPETGVILLTGWGQRLLQDEVVPPGVDRVLAKPPKLRELRAALADLAEHAC